MYLTIEQHLPQSGNEADLRKHIASMLGLAEFTWPLVGEIWTTRSGPLGDNCETSGDDGGIDCMTWDDIARAHTDVLVVDFDADWCDGGLPTANRVLFALEPDALRKSIEGGDEAEDDDSDSGPFEVERTGQSALAFHGEQRAKVEISTDGHGGELTRWFEHTLLLTRRGRFVCASTLHTNWGGEKNHHAAVVVDDVSAVAAAFQGLWPGDLIGTVIGYPPGAQFAEKQRRLEAELRQLFDRSISRLLDEADIAEYVE